METQKENTGQESGFLHLFEQIEVNNEEKIPAEDRQYCEQIQKYLDFTLNQLEHWYRFFVARCDELRNEYDFSFEKDGSVKYSDLKILNKRRENIIHYAFTPFKSINEITELYFEANEAFGKTIINYFRNKYSLDIDIPSLEPGSIKMGDRPTYDNYIDLIYAHTDGKSFREKAEEEVISKFYRAAHLHIHQSYHHKVQGNKIVFPYVATWDHFWLGYSQYKIRYERVNEFQNFCIGIAFGCDNILDYDYRRIDDFDVNEIDLSNRYDLGLKTPVKLKFFKNGRIDVLFENTDDLQRCYERLRLNNPQIEKELV